MACLSGFHLSRYSRGAEVVVVSSEPLSSLKAKSLPLSNPSPLLSQRSGSLCVVHKGSDDWISLSSGCTSTMIAGWQ